ncbi:MAG: hypothetical protein MI723_01075 [Caulobacterales bacterium]|nr:hypothetical protein [Caulobacterales bacterium]
MLRELWDERILHGEARTESLNRRPAKIESNVNSLLDRIIEASAPSVVNAFEARIQRLEEEKLANAQSIDGYVRPQRTFGDTPRTAIELLGSYWRLWEFKRMEDMHAVLKLTLCGPSGLCSQ